TDGGLDFGVVKVMDEAKHSLSLKNKGKYEIGFSFSLESSSPGLPDPNSIFSILPQKGSLSPSDRATQVQIIFQAKKEVQITDQPILKCQVRIQRESSARLMTHGMKRSREGSGSSRSLPLSKTKRSESQLRETNISGQARLALGMFVVSPGFGVVPPGGHQVIGVECLADQLGRSEEFVAIDISDRNPEDHPGGIPFRLVTEVCIPGFVTDDIGSIFEEHRIIRDARVLPCLPPLQSGGIYMSHENRFLFCNVIIGQTSCARFKITNRGKVACDVALSAKPLSSKSTARISDIFEIQPSRMTVPSHSHGFVSVSFTPQSMQMYTCVFEAAVDGMPSSLSKSQNLTFDICGEGNLPRVTITRPVLRNKQGNPVLLFQRLLIGQSQQLPLVLKNDGPIPAQ
ncbi:hydrocephalus-inducing protein homolog, partial [Mantella aurantiaca]